MTFGETLKRLRQRNNISQDELAKKLNVKQYVISSWEIGRSEPNIEQIKFLSTYFNVPTDYLLGKDIIIVSDEKEFEIVTNHFKQDINDDEIISYVTELFNSIGNIEIEGQLLYSRDDKKIKTNNMFTK